MQLQNIARILQPVVLRELVQVGGRKVERSNHSSAAQCIQVSASTIHGAVYTGFAGSSPSIIRPAVPPLSPSKREYCHPGIQMAIPGCQRPGSRAGRPANRHTEHGCQARGQASQPTVKPKTKKTATNSLFLFQEAIFCWTHIALVTRVFSFGFMSYAYTC